LKLEWAARKPGILEVHKLNCTKPGYFIWQNVQCVQINLPRSSRERIMGDPLTIELIAQHPAQDFS
jgi:hypothetical protein